MTEQKSDNGKKMSPVLKKILENKAGEVLLKKRVFTLGEMRKKAADAPTARPFAGGVLACDSRHKIIAEIKRFSPGNPKPRSDFDPATIAKSYEDAGAAAISVLTDSVFFGGAISFMAAARDAVGLPVLCKDFFLDPFQIYEARANGADAILLMAVNFESKSQFGEMIDVAKEAGVEALLEIHNESELEFLPGSRPSVMINNRDFRDDDLRVDISATKRIAPLVKSARMLISASGLKDSYTLDELKKFGVDAFLIGSSLMGESDPGAALRRLLGGK